MRGGHRLDLDIAHTVLCLLWVIFQGVPAECTIVLEPPSITAADTTTTEIEVTWSSPERTNFDNYLVMYQGINVQVALLNVTVETSVTMVSLSDLIPGETYRVTVAAINGSAMAISTPLSVTTKLNPPSFTSTIAVNTTSIQLTWAPSPSDFVERYIILYQGQNVHRDLARATTAARQLYLANLTPGESYLISLIAISGTERATIIENATITTQLNEPQIESLSSTNDTITISWMNLVDHVQEYQIKLTGQNIDTTPRFQMVAGIRGGTVHVVRNLTSGEIYSIVVTAISNDVTAESLAVLKTTVPNPPTITSFSSTLTTITLDWTSSALDHIDHYNINYQGINADTVLRNVNVTAYTESTTLVGLQSGETYMITVAAVSGPERGVSVESMKTTKLDKPSVVVASITSTTLTIAWALPTSYVEALLIDYQGLNIDTDHKNITGSGQIYIVVIRDLIPGETYVLTATVISGLERTADDSFNRTMQLNSPTITALTPTNTTLTVTWTSPPSDYVELYHIRYTHGGITEVVQTSGDIGELVLDSLNPGGDYFIIVQAMSGDQSAESLGKVVTLFPNQPLITSSTSFGTDSIGITWQSPPQDIISSYELHYTGQHVDTLRKEMALPVSTTSFNLTGLNPGETYEITVTVLTMGTSEFRRATSLIWWKTIALNPPSINLITSTSTIMEIMWSAMPGDYVEQYTIRIVDIMNNAPQPVDTVVDGFQQRLAVSSLTPGHTYDVTVIANSSDVFAFSAPRRETLNPESVQLRENGSTKKSITVEWDPPLGIVDSYTVSCSHGTPSADRFYYSNGITVASCTGLGQPGGDYTIIVMSHSGGKMSDPAAKVITALPDGVNLTESVSTTNSVEATWTNPLGAADEFVVNCDPANEATPDPASVYVVPNISEYSAKCVSLAGPGKIYTMTVTTVSGMKSSRSSTIQLTALPAAVVELTTTSIRTTSIDLSWRKDPTCSTCAYDSFIVAYTPDSPVNPTTVSEVFVASSYSVRFTGLLPGKEYTFLVRSERNGKLSRNVTLVQRTKPAQASIASNPTIANSSIIIYWSVPQGQHNDYRITMSPDEGAISGLANPSGAFITMLTPGKRYILSIVTVSGEMESDPTEYSFTTQPYSPGPVLNLGASILDKNSIRVTFNPPDQPNGQLVGYSVRYTGTADGRRNHVGTLPTRHDLSVNVGGLKPGFYYLFTVLAVNDYGLGQQTQSQPLYMMVYPPAAPTDANGSLLIPKAAEGATIGSVIASTSTITIVLEENIYTHDNGELVSYTIIVAEEEGVESYSPSTGEISSTLPTWSDVQESKPRPPYQAFEPRAYPFPPADSAGSRKRRSTTETVNIVIGNESCAGSTGYCNGPLTDDTSYVFHFRVFTQAGYADTAFSEPIKTDRDSSRALALGLGICFTLVFLAAVAFAIFIFWRKKRSKYGRHTKQGNENKGFESEVPVLNNQAISLKKKKSSRPIRLADFPSHYSAMKADSEYLFSEEYEELRNIGRSQPVEAATLISNRSKNRFANIQPYDHTRVKLTPIDDEDGSDYINANYMPGYNSPREFIACQGALPGTEEDMWRMVWEQKIETIVMVTQLFEKGRLKCHKYWPEEGNPQFYGDIQVAMMSEHMLKHWTLRQFTLQMGGKVRSIQHFNFTSWPDHGVPDQTEVLLSFVRTIRNQIPNNGTPSVVHCSAGVGRTGTFIALDRLMQHMREHDYVDIFGIVSEMRMHRNHMVQTEQQYVFIHECVIDLLQGHTSNGNSKIKYKPDSNINFKPDNTDSDDEHFL